MFLVTIKNQAGEWKKGSEASVTDTGEKNIQYPADKCVRHFMLVWLIHKIIFSKQTNIVKRQD